MRRLRHALVLAISICLAAIGQVSVAHDVANASLLQTGFAVVAPLTGSRQGLRGSETRTDTGSGNVFQASVLPSPLVTLTSVLVSFDSMTGADTGIAIVNPNDAATTLSLSLTNQKGSAVAARTITIGGRQQIAFFV